MDIDKFQIKVLSSVFTVNFTLHKNPTNELESNFEAYIFVVVWAWWLSMQNDSIQFHFGVWKNQIELASICNQSRKKLRTVKRA